MSKHDELEPYRAEFTAFCEHMEVGLKTQFPSLTQKEVLAVIGISLFAETRRLERDNAALMEDAAAQIQIAKEAVERETELRDTLEAVLEGWTLPYAVRKILETALWHRTAIAKGKA